MGKGKLSVREGLSKGRRVDRFLELEGQFGSLAV